MAMPEGDPAISFPAPVMTPQSNMLKAVHRADMSSLANRPVEGLSHALVERYEKMQREYEGISLQLKDACSEVEALLKKLSDEGSYTRGREEGLVEGQASVVAAFKASAEYAEEVFRQGTSFYADRFTACAEQFKNLVNLPPDFDYNFLDMRADGFGQIGGNSLLGYVRGEGLLAVYEAKVSLTIFKAKASFKTMAF
ncbi:hypothetical protein Salat_1848100 [Sesamum alatum]|uniref:Uncharacterized protein n=1 Tax=Sesamum alatum TaxID=300844 RepID=A0AAE1Y3Q9_9LAMI|nr:hypothetical protein Salat_1848100 [Sesamum alatum]